MGKKQQEVEAALANRVSGQSNKPLSKPAHALKHEEVIAEIKTNPDDGLTTAEATKRVEEYGRNEIGDQGGVNVTKILVRQIANAMILVLLLAMGVSFGIGSYVSPGHTRRNEPQSILTKAIQIEGGVVTAVILLNIVIGFGQEYHAEKTMDSLRNLASPTACVIRDGNIITIPNVEAVPGDIVVLKTGDTVPAVCIAQQFSRESQLMQHSGPSTIRSPQFRD